MSRSVLLLFLGAIAATLVAAACDTSDDAERLAAQRLFRNYLIEADSTAAADVRIEGFVDELPPDFPLAEGLELLGSAFTDTDTRRQLIVGWQTDDMHADDLFEFYSDVLSEEPWDIVGDPRLVGIDFISFTDEDNAAFRGELRINQEGDIAVLVLVATELLSSVDAGGT